MHLLFFLMCFILKWPAIADSNFIIPTKEPITTITTTAEPKLLQRLQPNIETKDDEVVHPMALKKPFNRRKEEFLLREALSSIILRELKDCSLLVAVDEGYLQSDVLLSLVGLPQQKQVMTVRRPEDFLSWLWTSTLCRGYIFLFMDPHPFLNFANSGEEPWDYQGKFVFVGFNKKELDNFTASKKGKKTHHMIGLIQHGVDTLGVYMNQLYWGEGVVPVNRWQQHGFTSGKEIFPDKTKDLRAATLSMITFEFKPHVFYDEDGVPYGREMQIAEALADAINFTLLKKTSPKGDYWGFPDANGTWNGMTGYMQRNEAHFGLAHFFLTDNDNLADAVDYTLYYDVDMSCFMARIEPPLPKWLSLAAPFQRDTWMSLGIGFLVFCPILSIISNIYATSKNDINDADFQLSDSFLYTLGIHLRISQIKLPIHSGTRIWVLYLWLYAIILTAGYSSNLTAFLTVERRLPGMETIAELHGSNLEVISICCFYKVSLERSENVYLKALADRHLEMPSNKDFKNLLSKGEAVFLETRTYLEHLIASNFTKLGISSKRILKECYSTHSVAVAMQNHLPMKESFDRVLGTLIETGIAHKWYLDSLQSHTKIYGNSDHEKENSTENESSDEGSSSSSIVGVIPLNISHMQGIFYIYLLGIVLATFTSILEKSYHKRQ